MAFTLGLGAGAVCGVGRKAPPSPRPAPSWWSFGLGFGLADDGPRQVAEDAPVDGVKGPPQEFDATNIDKFNF